jgi:hypothetical protein
MRNRLPGVKLAARVIVQLRCRSGEPLLPSEVAQLRFFAESEAESMPLEKLALTIIQRERERIGHPPHSELGFGDRN